MHISDNYDGSPIFSDAACELGETAQAALDAGVSLARADLERAYMPGVDFKGTSLRETDLSNTNLNRANLSGCDLSDAILWYANLTNANVTGANFDRACLEGTKLTGTDLSTADLSNIKADFLDAIGYLPDEVPYLRDALVNGKIDGSQYEGDCCCLAGTMAKAVGFDFGWFRTMKCMPIDPESPREVWFTAIKPGDSPENSQIARITLAWIDEFLAKMEAEAMPVEGTLALAL